MLEAHLLLNIVKLILAKGSALISQQKMFSTKVNQSMILRNSDLSSIKFSLTKKEAQENLIHLAVQLTNTKKLSFLQDSITTWAKE